MAEDKSGIPPAKRFPQRIIPSPPPGWESWEALMDIALEEAAKARSHGEVPVGALVVGKDGTILGRGHNRPVNGNDPTAHAEVEAIRAAAANLANYRLGGGILVCTLEPCLMCVGAALHARLDGIVYGAPDPKAGVMDSCMEALDLPFNNHIAWRLGSIREEECRDLLQQFFEELR